MKTKINGQNYNFCIVADRNKFYIEAVHTGSLRFSFINNLNVILSEFDVGMDDEKISESQWIISEIKNKLFSEKAIKFLSDKICRNYLEEKLEEDRKYGEWENRKII